MRLCVLAILFIAVFNVYGADHPRLLFSGKDIPELRSRINSEPVKSMFTKLKENWDSNIKWGSKPSPYNHSYSAVNAAFLYILTGDKKWAEKSREKTEWVIKKSSQWNKNIKGLRLYMHGRCVALAYDMCFDAWDENFRQMVSKELKKHGEFILKNGGREQNKSAASNWQGARFASAGLCLLASDEEGTENSVNSCWKKTKSYFNANLGSSTSNNSGWNTEGLGYQYFAMGNFCGPFTIAMANMRSENIRKSMPQVGNSFWSVYAATVQIPSFDGTIGVRPDFCDDNPGTRGEGCYGLAFYFAPKELQSELKWCYDRLKGDKGDREWDLERAGIIYSILYYPLKTAEKDPMNSEKWKALFNDRSGNGMYTFRNSYNGSEDQVAQYFVKHRAPGGHSGPDSLSFRILGGGEFFGTGGGRYGKGNVYWQSMNTLYPQDPAKVSKPTRTTGKTIASGSDGNGGGFVISSISKSNVYTDNFKRTFIASYDQKSGADAVYIIADKSDNGKFWQMCALEDVKISTLKNGFVMKGTGDATLQGISLLNEGELNVTTGVRNRGSSARWKNQIIEKNSYVHMQSSNGDHLVVLTISNGKHPSVSLDGKDPHNCTVKVGNLTFKINPDSVQFK